MSFLKEDFEFQLNKQLLWDSVISLKDILVVEIMDEVTESVSYNDFTVDWKKMIEMKDDGRYLSVGFFGDLNTLISELVFLPCTVT